MMKRIVLTAVASSLATALVIVGVGAFAAHSFLGPLAAEAAPMAFGAGGFGPGGAFGPAAFGPAMAQDLPPEIRGLHDLPADQRFSHFLNAEMRFTDTNGVAHAVRITPGTVSSVSSDSLTVKPNDSGQGGTKSFKLTGDTRIHQAGALWRGTSPSQAQLKDGDKVVVVALDSGEARAVMIGGPDGFRPGFGPHRG
jgi:hypothetical protein